MAMADDRPATTTTADVLLTEEDILEFFLSKAGEMRNSELIKHFRSALKSGRHRNTNRRQFPHFVNRLATVRVDADGRKILTLKGEFMRTRSQDCAAATGSTLREEHGEDDKAERRTALPETADVVEHHTWISETVEPTLTVSLVAQDNGADHCNATSSEPASTKNKEEDAVRKEEGPAMTEEGPAVTDTTSGCVNITGSPVSHEERTVLNDRQTTDKDEGQREPGRNVEVRREDAQSGTTTEPKQGQVEFTNVVTANDAVGLHRESTTTTMSTTTRQTIDSEEDFELQAPNVEAAASNQDELQDETKKEVTVDLDNCSASVRLHPADDRSRQQETAANHLGQTTLSTEETAAQTLYHTACTVRKEGDLDDSKQDTSVQLEHGAVDNTESTRTTTITTTKFTSMNDLDDGDDYNVFTVIQPHDDDENEVEVVEVRTCSLEEDFLSQDDNSKQEHFSAEDVVKTNFCCDVSLEEEDETAAVSQQTGRGTDDKDESVPLASNVAARSSPVDDLSDNDLNVEHKCSHQVNDITFVNTEQMNSGDTVVETLTATSEEHETVQETSEVTVTVSKEDEWSISVEDVSSQSHQSAVHDTKVNHTEAVEMAKTSTDDGETVKATDDAARKEMTPMDNGGQFMDTEDVRKDGEKLKSTEGANRKAEVVRKEGSLHGHEDMFKPTDDSARQEMTPMDERGKFKEPEAVRKETSLPDEEVKLKPTDVRKELTSVDDKGRILQRDDQPVNLTTNVDKTQASNDETVGQHTDHVDGGRSKPSNTKTTTKKNTQQQSLKIETAETGSGSGRETENLAESDRENLSEVKKLAKRIDDVASKRMSSTATMTWQPGRPLSSKTLLDRQATSTYDFSMDETIREWTMRASRSDYQALSKLLGKNPALASRRDFITGYSALHWAAKNGSCDVVKLLLGSRPAPDVNTTSHGGYTALHIACMNSRHEVIDLLVVVYKANTDATDFSGRKPIYYLAHDAVAGQRSSAFSRSEMLLAPKRGARTTTPQRRQIVKRQSAPTDYNPPPAGTPTIQSLLVVTRPMTTLMLPPRDLPAVVRRRPVTTRQSSISDSHSDSETTSSLQANSQPMRPSGSTSDIVGTLV